MNVFQQFITSFYAPKIMATFRFQGIGKTILYIFLMMFIVSIPIAIKMSLTITNGTDKALQMLKNTPEFQFENGTLISESDEPFHQTDDDFFLIIDPSNNVSIDEVKNYPFGIIFFEKEAIIVENGSAKTYSYQQLGNFTLNKTEFIKLVDTINALLGIFIPLLLIFLYLFTTGMKFIGITVLATIGILIRNKAEVRLNYKQLWVLATYAVTLPTTIFNVLEAFAIYIPFGFLFYWVIAILMLYFVINNIPKPKMRTINA